MRRASRRKRSLYSALLILVLLGIAISAGAQSPADDAAEDDDAKPTPSLNVSVIFSEDGAAQVSFYAFGQPSTDAEIKAVLESSLSCTLQGKSPYRTLQTQFYNGSCTPAFQRSSMLRESRIATAPLRKYALDHQIELLTLNVRLPDVDIAQTQPPATTPMFRFDKMPASVQHIAQLNHTYSWHTASAIPALVTVRFGLSSKSVTRAEYTLLGILLLPALLIFWMGRKALSSEAQDKAVVWFTYMRCLQWTLNLSMLAWWSVAYSLHSVQILQFLSLGTPLAPIWKYPVAATLVNWVPPAILCVLCLALSHPVQEKLRGLTWTRRELAMQGVYSFCASLLPIALFLTGITTMAKSSVRTGMLWIVVAFAVAIVASRALQKFLGMQPQALTTGDLRNRAFAMARQLNVKLQQVYVIPSGKGQMANAFARRGNVISFTDFLLQRMSRREVNYVLGHEMLHLKLGHPGNSP